MKLSRVSFILKTKSAFENYRKKLEGVSFTLRISLKLKLFKNIKTTNINLKGRVNHYHIK